MGGNGPVGKDPEKRQRRNAAPAETKLVRGSKPESAPGLPNAAGFSEETREWYAIWAASEVATLFTATDWQRLWMLAELVDQYYEGPTKELLGEIRLNEASLGATVADRKRLGARVVDGNTAAGSSKKTSRRRKDPRRHLKAV